MATSNFLALMSMSSSDIKENNASHEQVSSDHQGTDLEAGPLSDIDTSNSDNTAEPNPPGKSQCHADKKEGSTAPDWREIYHDAVELESLLFCVRRPTSRDRLFKLVHNLKQLSGKLKRFEEVTAQLNRKDETMIQNADGTDRKRNRIVHLTTEENKQESHDDCNLPKRKRPRAIPLDSFTFDQKIGTSSKLSSDASNSNTISNPELKFPESFDSTAEPPSLKIRHKWVQHHAKGSNLHCPDFDASNSCPLGNNCNFLHIFTPRKQHPAQEDGNKVMVKYRYTKEDVDSVYETYRNVSLAKTDHAEKIKCDGRSNPNYSFSITCPIDRMVYYACPFPGDAFVKANKNRQGIWWYTTMKDAKDAVSTLIICDLKERGIVPKDYKPREITIGGDWDAGKRSAKASQLARKALSGKMKEKIMAPPILPNITPCNFMESGYEKRCSQFNTQQGCSFGSKCTHAHVHFHTGKVSNEFPTKDALPRAYREIFQMDLIDSFFQGSSIRNGKSPFHVMTAVDNRGDLWYTAALKCPREGTIYYAAGGNTGMVNKQNMVLYHSMEEAKLAVCGIVLDSFK